VWAEYSPDIQEQFKHTNCGIVGEWEYKIPSELEEALSSKSKTFLIFIWLRKTKKLQYQ
jgi:hypothetical protein